MAKTDKANAALPYIRRLLEDEYVQEQLREAAGGLRGAYGRVRQSRTKAVEDKRLHDQVRQAATSLRRATTALQRPKAKPKRRLPKLAAAGLAAAGTALLLGKRGERQP